MDLASTSPDGGINKVLQTLAIYMSVALDEATDRIRSFLQREDGQGAFEYMLIVGGVSVTVVAAVIVIANAVPGVATMTCNAIGTIANYAGFTC
jgi:Flp pilus assembly pilin Flp